MDNRAAKTKAIEAATRAGEYIKQRLGNFERIDYKSAFNLVTDVDKGSEELILSILRTAFPQDNILAEEGGGAAKSGGRRWLIDPLDGTTNFAHSYPFFSVSIGLEIDGILEVGVVFNPISGELFSAERGGGAFLNDKRIHVSDVPALDKSLLATGFPPDTAKAFNRNIESFSALTDMTHGVRRDGSAALDLCFVASGRLDGFWEFKLAPWDLGAGVLIVTESGGTVTNLTGGQFDISTGHVLASNGKIHSDIVKVLDRYYSPAINKQLQ